MRVSTISYVIVFYTAFLIQGCSDSSDTPNVNDAIVSQAERAATDVLERHMVARNSEDAKGIAAEYNYTEIRLAGRQIGRTESEESATVFEEKVVMPFLKATGWKRSEWDKIKIVQSSSNKVHFELIFSRFDAQGNRYLTSPTFWAVTKQDNKWGIKLRSSYAEDQGDGNVATAEAAAIKVLEARLDARNNRDSDKLAALNSYPLAYLQDVELTIFETIDEYILYEEAVVIPALDYSEWSHSVWGALDIVQSSENKVHIIARLDHISVTGENYESQDQFYAIVDFGGEWKIQALSNFVDAVQRN